MCLRCVSHSASYRRPSVRPSVCLRVRSERIPTNQLTVRGQLHSTDRGALIRAYRVSQTRLHTHPHPPIHTALIHIQRRTSISPKQWVPVANETPACDQESGTRDERVSGTTENCRRRRRCCCWARACERRLAQLPGERTPSSEVNDHELGPAIRLSLSLQAASLSAD